LTLNASTGVISGTPTASASPATPLAFRVNDANGCQGSRSITLQICPVVSLSLATLPTPTVGTAYSQTLTASGGSAAYTYTLASGTLPAWATLSSTGVLSGTPNSTTSATFTVKATDANGCAGTLSYTVTPVCPTITIAQSSLPQGTVGTAYSQTLTASGGTAPYGTWTITSGALPTGLTLNASTGVISGTPTASASPATTLTVRVNDTYGCQGSQNITLQICPVVSLSPTSPASGTVGTAYSQTIAASGGSSSYVFTISSGTLPAGLTLNASTGVVSGTPTTQISSNVTLKATDSNGCAGTLAVTFAISCPVITVTPTTLAQGTVGSAFSQTIAASGGSSSYVFTISSGTLPAGLTLNTSTGVISGTPTSSNAGGTPITVSATDSFNCSGTKSYTLQVCPVITLSPATLATPTVGTAYSQSITASGSSTAYTYTLASGSLPAWATLSSTGVLTGTPNSTTTAAFNVKATDANGCVGTLSYTLSPICPTITIAQSTLPQGTVGTAYSQTLTASGGVAPYSSWTITSGTLPAGLTLNASTGVVSGTPTASASPATSITVRVNDVNGCQGSRSITLQICPVVTLAPATLTAPIVGTTYSQSITASGGTASYTYTLASGALPAWATLSSAGVLSGAPTNTTAATFTVKATDGNGCAGTLAYTVTPVCPTISIAPASLAQGTVGSAYSQTLSASGGTAAYTYAITTGSLPTGLSLNASTGVLAGTITSTTAATFTVSATDANNCAVTSSYTITPATTDFGDFASFGTASSTYSSSLKIGVLTDTESAATTNATATGDDITGIDDEDGVTLPAYIVQSAAGSITVNVTNNTGASAFLNAWIDYNNNGVLTDSGEQVATNTVIATGTSNANKTITFTVPATASVGTVGVRVRLTSTSSPGSTGASGNGEVEDNVIGVLAPSDFGDFSLFGIAGSTLSTTLRMGAQVDSEASSLANSTATGDDITGVDDEDGVTLPATIIQGQTGASVTVNVTNSTGADAYLNGWIDFNNNGVLTDAGEQIVVNDVVSTGTSSSNRIYTFTVPSSAVVGVIGVRFRLCSTATPGGSGAVGTGEVEDNTLTVLPASDHGDFSLFADASSYISNFISLGDLEDAEVTPVTNLAATGDDITNIADEEGVTLQAILVQGQAGVAVTVKLNNSSGAATYLNGWVDFNNNGVVTDAGEQVITDFVVATGTTDGYQTFFFDVPKAAALGVVGARFRLTSVATPGPTGAVGNGEVEDYTTTIVAPSANFRDYFYTIRNVSGHFYLDEISVYNPNSSTPTVSVKQGILDLNVASPGFDTTATDAIMNGLALDWLNRRFYWAATSTGSSGYNFNLYTAAHDNVAQTWSYQLVNNSAMTNVPLNTGSPVSATASSGAFPRAAFYNGEYYAGGQLSNNVAVWHLNSNGLGLNTPNFTDYTTFFHISQTFNGGDFVIRPQDGLLVTSTVVNSANTLFTQFYSNGINPSGPAASTSNIDAGIPYASNNSVQIAGVGGVSRLYALGSGGSTVFRIDNYATASPTAVTVGPLPTASYPDLSEGMSSSVTSLGVKGIVYNDPNGLADGILSGTGTNTSGQLYAMLVDASGNLVDSFPVKSDGTFILGGASANTTYQVVLSTSYGSLGSTAPTPALPAGWLNAGEFLGSGAGSDGTVDGRLTVAIGSVGVVNATFGLMQTLSIGDQVWNDVNNNGLFDTGESGIGGVTVQLWSPGSDNAIGGTGSAADSLLATTTTDGTGAYSFANLAAEKYFVTVTPPTLYSVVSSTAAGDNGVDNDNNGSQPGGRGTTVYSPIVTLAQGTEPGNLSTGGGNFDDTIDFGLLTALDFGDYASFGSAGSALVSNLFLGTLTDSEYSAIVDTNATGDDLNNLDDEDGVVVPAALYAGVSATLTVTVTNTSGAAAFLHAWVDFNANGVLTDAGEQVASNVVIANGTNATNRNLTFTVPAGATQGKVGVRVRLTSVSTPGSVGTAGNGEVEDYVSNVCPVVSLSPGTLPAATVGSAFSQTFTASGGTAPYTYAVSSGALPAWAVLSSAGVLSGTPNSTTAATFTVKATDTKGCAGTVSFTITPLCATVSITPAALAQGTVGTAYSQTLTASGGAVPYGSWAVTSGTLPAGLTLNPSTGVISGTPTASASPATTLTFRVNDANGCQGTQPVTLQVCPVVTLAPASLPTPTVGTAYSQTITASGGATPYSYTVSSGALPAWATLSSAGVLSGTPLNTTVATFTLKATDTYGCAGTLSYTLAPVCPTITITPAALAQGTVGTAYSQTLTATGGIAPYSTWTLTSGTLPAGLTLNASTGVISGTPTASASPVTPLTFRVNDTNGCQGTQNITLQVCPVVTLSPATLPTPTVGTAYSQSLTASGGTAAYTYTLASGTLPTWATLSSTGVLSGTPNSTTASTFTVKATDANGCAVSLSYTVTPVCPTITITQSSLPQGTVGTSYSQTLTASGGTAPYSTWTLTSGSLPAGLTLNASTGVISGTPTASASPATTITVRANDTYGCQGSRSITLQICPVITLAPATPATGTVGTAYTQTITASGSTTSYTYAVASGTLPAGLTLNASTGVVSGTPTTPISSNVTLRATDANGCAGTLAVTFAISCPVITVAPTTLALGTVGSAYLQTVTASGGSSSYVFAVSSGTLPAGLTLNSSTGVISGTPVTSNTSGTSITISATDSFNCSGTKNYNLQVCPVITLSPATLPTPTVGTAYSQTISSSGGAASYTYTLASGSLPAWATLSSAGVLSGTPNNTTAATFTVKATDAYGCTGTLAYTVTPVCPTITIAQSSLPQGTMGTAYSQTLTASGGIAPYSTWTITAGTLPTGLTLNASTGVVSGTPTASASPATSVTVRTSDVNGCQGSRSITLQVCPVVTLTPATLPNGTINSAYSQTVSASGGLMPYAYAVSSGSLPTGLTLNTSTGVISGTPTSVSSMTFVISATDANGCATTVSYTVAPAPDTDYSDFSLFGTAGSRMDPTLLIGATTDTEATATTNTTATGDDITGIDDEDGVTIAASITQGAAASMTVNVTNVSGASAFLNVWIDFNNNGVLTDAGEQIATNTVIATGTSKAVRTINFFTPVNATLGVVGVRSRLTSTSSPGATGTSGNGEVEDVVTTITAPTTDFGDFSLFADAWSTGSNNLILGALVDLEGTSTLNATATGDDITNLDDEDGVTFPSMTAGQPITLPVTVTNLTGSAAYLNAWIDFNNNGVLTDAGEQIATNVSIPTGTSGGTASLSFTVPTNAVTAATTIGTRFRLTSIASPGPTGAAGTGEVEDHGVTLLAPLTDFSDFSGAPNTSNTASTSLRLGALVDTEYAPTVDANAMGDDLTGVDDEDGVTVPAMTSGAPATVAVVATNITGAGAYLNAWIDFNNNGVFTDSGEQIATNTAVPIGTTNGNYNLTFTVPATAVTGTNLGVRVRVTADISPGSTGAGGVGEVEDNVVNIALPTTDFGDYSLFSLVNATTDSRLRLGALTDTEYVATTNATATGDDITNLADEDAVTLPSMIAGAPATIPVVVTNTIGTTAFINAWIDYNGNGSLADAGEQIATNVTVPTGTSNSIKNLSITVPATCLTGVNLGVRVMLTAATSPVSTGNVGTGEIEDYVVNITAPTTDFGDFSGFADASQGISPSLRMGALVDAEYVSTRNATATGDDITNLADEDGVTLPSMTASQTVTIPVVATNSTGALGYLNAWIDFNNNGVLTDSGEQLATNLSIPTGTTNATQNLNITVPAGATAGANIGMRVRLTSVASPGVTGTVGNGEVEDYVTTIAVPTTDFGDWISAADASSIASSNLRMGAIVDTEYVSTRNAAATGDDITNLADEDGVTLPSQTPGTVGSASVVVTNNTGAAGYLNAWIDYNNNGSFADSGEQIATNTSIATGTNGVVQTVSFIVPVTAIPGQRGARFRLTSTQNTTSVGASGTGEVEDYLVTMTCLPIALSPTTLSTPTVGTAYSQTVTASGSTAPYTYSIGSGALPAGLTLSSAGVISGTPTSSSAATFSIVATDTYSCTGSLSYTVTPVCPTITVSPGTLPSGSVGTAYSQTLSASGGTAGYTFAVSSGTLPAGLTLNASTGVISGTPTTSNAGGVSLTFKATDAHGCTGTVPINLIICPVITLSPATLPAPTVGTAYSQTITAAGSTAAYTYTLASGTLPTWATLSSSGVLSGTPTSTTAATFTVRATDANGCTGTLAYTVTPVCPTITVTPAALPQGTVGTAYSQTLAASGGVAPYSSWTITAGTLPAGLSLNASTGVISGTPTASASPATTITFRASDANGCQGSRAITLQVCPVITVAPATLTTPTVGTAYSQTITASGGTSSYSYTVSSGALPAWAALSPAGVLSGTPNNTTSATFTVKATDANGCSGTLSYTVTPVCPTITIAQSALPQGTVGTAYLQTLTASGGIAPYSTWTITTGSLPAGLTLNASTGVISGTPTASASPATSITVSVNDTNGCQGTKNITLQICPVVTLTPATLTTPTVGTAYSQPLSASGGTSAYTYTVSSGALPAWATLSPSGVLSGTPNNTTAATFAVKATDANGCAGTLSYTVTPVCPAISITPISLAQGTVGTAYSQTLSASGGTAPYGTWAITTGTLPTGLTLNASTGIISGTPTASASPAAGITLRVNDTYGCQGTQIITLQICPVVTVSPATLTTPTVGTAYSQTITAAGGTSAYTYTVSSGALPAWATLSSTGVLSGTPTSATSATFTVKATDANGCAGTRSYTLTPVCPTITITQSSLPQGTVGTAYSQTLSASGGIAPYSAWTITAGTLPAGLTLDTVAGTISGTPTASASPATSITVRANDANGCQGSRAITLQICPVITLAPATPATGTVGTAYSQTIAASGGTASYTFAVASGTLPAGLTLNASTGVVSGTPSTQISSNVTLRATDANGCQATLAVTFAISCPVITVAPTTLALGTVGSAYSQTITASGGSSSYVFAVSSGTLPAGLTLNASTGVISGTPTASNALGASITISATDSFNCAGTKNYTLQVCPVITLPPATLPTPTVGTAYSQTITASGSAASYTYTLASGTLPAWATLSSSGVLSGTPTSTTAATFTVRATDANGCTGTLSYTVTPVCPAITIAQSALPQGTVGTAYLQTLTASGGVTPYGTWAITTGTLPAGLTLNASTGVISGTPTASASPATSITFRVNDTNGCQGSRAITLQICPVITLAPATLTTPTVGTAYSQTITASGGTSAYTYTVSNGSLPAWTTLSSAGVLSGTPNNTTSATFTVKATDTNGCAGTLSYTVTPVCPTITIAQSALPQGTVGTAYSQTLTASGGISPYSTWTITTGSLPTGLTLNASTGVISGTPTASASPATTITVSVNDTNGCQGTKNITLQICPVVTLSPATLTTPTVGTAYSQTLSASGGTSAYTYTVSSGALPAWATLSPSGVLSGTPNNTTAATFTVKAIDANGCAGTLSYTVTPVCPAISITPTSLTQGTVGTAYSQTLTASGGTAPYSTWTITTGTLPAGLTLNASTGIISGTPTASASPATSITMRVNDTYGCQGTQVITLQICPVITLSPTTLAAPTVNTAYSQTITAAGGTATYTYTVSSGTLPAWATLSSAGVLSGTPTTVTSATFTVKATDANGCAGTRSYTLTPACQTITVAPATLPNGTVNSAYSQTITSSGSVGTVTFAISSGSLPAGLSLNTSTGVISGTPTSTTAATFTVRATDANGCTGSTSYTVTPACPTINVTPTTLATGGVGVAYSQTLAASGGIAPYASWTVTSGTLPAGLTLSASTGIITGTPTTSNGTGVNVTVRTTDANGCQGSAVVSIKICPVITQSPATLTTPVIGIAYSQTIAGAGGVSPYTFTLTSGSLPSGLTLSSSGTISGTTPSGTSATFTVKATAADGCSGTASYTLTPVCPTLTLSPTTLPFGYLGTAYTQVLTTSGGTAPYTYAIQSGSLPGGVALAANGSFSGTPTAIGSFPISVSVTDANSCAQVFSLTLQVHGLSIGNLVFEDSNNNGVWDTGEPGVANATVQLFNPGSDNAIGGTGTAADVQVGSSLTTDATGAYLFSSLPAGVYYVEVTPPVDYLYTGGTPDTADDFNDNVNHGAQPGGAGTPLFSPIITLTGGQEPTNDGDNNPDTNLTIDFGLWSSVAVGNMIFLDINGDGHRNEGESLGNIYVELYAQGATAGVDTPVSVGTSGCSCKGRYYLDGLNPGSYFLHIPASQFSAGMPLQGLLPMSTVVLPADDDVGQDLIFNNNPAVNGASTRVFSLRPGYCPVGAAESGAEGTSDDAIDARVDLTLDLGIVAPSGTGFAANELIRRYIVTGGFVANVPAGATTFALWSQDSTIGGPLDDPDQDGMPNLLEYALGTDPTTPLQPNHFSLTHDATTGSLTALLTQPSATHYDLIVSLETLSDITQSGNASAWKKLSMAAAVTINADGTLTRAYSNLENLLVFQGLDSGFLRLNVGLDANRDGIPEATVTSAIQGWGRQTFATGSRTFSMPLLNASSFTGQVSAVSSNEITLQYILTTLPAGSLYLDVLDGPLAGQRFDIDSTSSSGNTLVLQNAAQSYAGLVNAHISIRVHHTLAELLPPAAFSSADRVLFFDPSVSNYTTYTNSSGSWLNDVLSMNARPFAAHEAAMLQVRGSGTTLMFTGEVRQTKFVTPLVAGTQLIATTPWPVVTPAPVTGLSSGLTPDTADRFRIWDGDTTPSASDYTGYYLDGSTTPPAWLPQNAPAPDAYLFPFHGYFLIRTAPLQLNQTQPW